MGASKGTSEKACLDVVQCTACSAFPRNVDLVISDPKPALTYPNQHLNFRKILMSVKNVVCNSGAGNGCANFMGAWKNAFFLQAKTHVRKISPFSFFFWGGGGVPILFLWARGFF